MGKCLRGLYFLLVAASAMAAPTIVCAEDLLALQSGEFREEMPEAPRASGQRLLGIQLGDASGLFDPSAFRIALGARPIDQPLCVKVTTRDGRYWSLNQFTTAGVGAGIPALDFKTGLGERLAKYPMSEFAVRASAQAGCDEDEIGTLVPAVLSNGENSTLTLMVNGGNPLSVGARLSHNDKPFSETRCERPTSGASVGFNFICRLSANGLQGAAEVTLFLKDMSGSPINETYQIRLPSTDGAG